MHQHTMHSSIVCSLVSATIADIDCVEQFRESCDEIAVELFAPMRSETEQVLIEHNCAASTPETNKETSTTPKKITLKVVEQEIRVPNFSFNLSDALFSLRNLDGVCQRHLNPNNVSDLWAPIRVKICHKKPELKTYFNCFEEAAIKLNNDCPGNVSFY